MSKLKSPEFRGLSIIHFIPHMLFGEGAVVYAPEIRCKVITMVITYPDNFKYTLQIFRSNRERLGQTKWWQSKNGYC